MNKIKVCNENLITALKACAKAHNAKFEDWSEEGQIGINAENIPTYADVKSIVGAFYKEEYAEDVEMGWGYVTAFLYGEEAFRDEVDEMALKMALPYNCKPKWIKE